MFAVIAVPAFWAATFALAGFTGCFIECAQPGPTIGVLWTGIALVLLACPVVAGLVAVWVRSRRGWLIVAAAVVILLAGYRALQGVV